MALRIIKPKGDNFLSPVLFLIIAVQLSAVSASMWQRRHWDLLAYIGVSYALDGLSVPKMHKATYRAAREGSTAAAFRYLTERPAIAGRADYRVVAYRSPAVFAEQLPFYSVKRFYPAAIWALGKAGVPPIFSASIITFAGYLAVTTVLFFWLCEFLSAGLAFGVTGVVMTSIYMMPLAFLRTPDTWAATLITLAFYQASHSRFATAAAVTAAAIFVRPDAVIALATICGLALSRGYWRVAAFGAAAGVGFCLATTAGGYAWTTFFYHSFVAALLYPAEFQSPLGLQQYLAIYAERIVAVPFLNPIFPGALVVGALAVLMRIQRAGWRDTYAVLVLLVLGCMIAHWLVYPAGVTRHQMPYYLVIVVALARHFAGAFANVPNETPKIPAGEAG